MTTIDAPISQAELSLILDFFKKNNIAWLGNDGDKNGVVFGQFFDQWMTSAKRDIPFTQQTLDIAFKKLQEAGSLIFYSADEAQYHIYEEQYPAELKTIKKFLPTYNLSASTEDESLYMNTNAIMEYAVSTNRVHQITKEALQTMIGNLINRPKAGQLRWAPKPKQDWEKERDRKAEEAEKAAEAYREYHRKLTPEYQEQERLKRQAEEIEHSNDAYWQQRVNSYIASIQSHVLRGEAEELFGKQAMNANWQVNFVSLENWLSKKKNQPGHWY